MMQLQPVDSTETLLWSFEDQLYPVDSKARPAPTLIPRGRPSTAAASVKRSIELGGYPAGGFPPAGQVASSLPVTRPGSAFSSLPSLRHPPSQDGEQPVARRDPPNNVVKQLRQRNRQLEAEVEGVEAHYRSLIQAYADNGRMYGMSRPPDKLVAYWAEAQRLMNNAIDQHYGGGVDGSRLSAEELMNVRAHYEQRVLHANGQLEQALAQIDQLHMVINEKQTQRASGPSGGGGGVAVSTQTEQKRPGSASRDPSQPASPSRKPKLEQPSVPLLVHESKIKEIQVRASSSF